MTTFEQSLNALAHSAQADGVIERATALWVIGEAQDVMSELNRLRSALTEAMEALEPFANEAEFYPDVPDTSGLSSPIVKVEHLRKAVAIIAKHKDSTHDK